MRDDIFEVAINKGYYCNKEGNIFSKRGKINPYVIKGYARFSVRYNSNSKYITYHRFIGYIKYGDAIFDKKLCIRHLDGNSLNNSWDNLKIGTHRENSMDKPKELRIKCAKYAAKKYSDDIINSLKKDRESGFTYNQLKEKYNICKSMLSYYLGKDCKRKEVLL